MTRQQAVNTKAALEATGTFARVQLEEMPGRSGNFEVTATGASGKRKVFILPLTEDTTLTITKLKKEAVTSDSIA